MISILKKFAPDFSQASTWRGFITIITALGVSITPEQAASIIALGLAVTGAIGAFIKDKIKE